MSVYFKMASEKHMHVYHFVLVFGGAFYLLAKFPGLAVIVALIIVYINISQGPTIL